jgi:hypothetical protein
VEDNVLRNLRDCMHLNSSAADAGDRVDAGSGSGVEHAGTDVAGNIGALQQSVDAPVSGIDGPSSGSATQRHSWDSGNMRVRCLDWLESLRALEGRAPLSVVGLGSSSTAALFPPTTTAGQQQPKGGTAADRGEAGGLELEPASAPAAGGTDEDDDLVPDKFYAEARWRRVEELAASAAAATGADADKADCDAAGGAAPCVPLDARFSRIIGTEVIYEPMHGRLVAAVLAHRLTKSEGTGCNGGGGAALLCCAVRNARTFAAFASECARRRLRYRSRQVGFIFMQASSSEWDW